MPLMWDHDRDSAMTGRGFISTDNSSSSPLVGDAVFTGNAEECSGFAVVTVFVYSDVASATDGLSLELSTDGTNWDRKKTLTLEAGESQAHSLTIVSQYFRLVYTNGSDAQTDFRLQSIFHATAPRSLTSGTQQTLRIWDDTTLVRPVTDVPTDLNSGRIAYMSAVAKFGSNEDVGTGAYEDIWAVGGAYNWLTAASALRIKAGGNAADDAGQAGARTVTIEGLDENWNAASETVNAAGASASDPTTTTFIRINRAYVGDVGAYTGANTGAVDIETTGGTLVARIAAGVGQTQLGLYSVPAGKTAYLTRTYANVSAGANKSATIRGWRRENADTVSAPFQGKRLFDVFEQVSGAVQVAHSSYNVFPAKTDIWYSAIADANATQVDIHFDITLVDN